MGGRKDGAGILLATRLGGSGSRDGKLNRGHLHPLTTLLLWREACIAFAFLPNRKAEIALSETTQNLTSHENAPARRITSMDWAMLAVRIIVGIIFMAHGAQKLFGAFGGAGLATTVEKMGPIGYLVTVGEFFGGLGLIVGFLSRFSAASIIVIMIGAIQMVHGKNGFFLSNGGFEYNLALIGLLLPIFMAGPGKLAIGRFLPLPRSRDRSRPILFLE